jgi:hypothetical protein
VSYLSAPGSEVPLKVCVGTSHLDRCARLYPFEGEPDEQMCPLIEPECLEVDLWQSGHGL